ncbi:hypothetical protein D9M69_613990 [compost metagenome]
MEAGRHRPKHFKSLACEESFRDKLLILPSGGDIAGALEPTDAGKEKLPLLARYLTAEVFVVLGGVVYIVRRLEQARDWKRGIEPGEDLAGDFVEAFDVGCGHAVPPCKRL